VNLLFVLEILKSIPFGTPAQNLCFPEYADCLG